MEEFVLFIVSILSCIAGAICGIGSGVIIKPILDAVGILSVSCISFLSGCTVLSMSIVSVYKHLKNKSASLNIKFATFLAVGAVFGGACGKSMFESLKSVVGNENLVGMTQAVVLVIITLGTLVYTIKKQSISTKKCTQVWVCLIIGFLLGICSSFLGIGGGPINLVVLAYFFLCLQKRRRLALCILSCFRR